MEPPSEAERRIGTTICGKWRLEKLLGVGGMAAVYVGAHRIGRREAIKILHPDVARSPELRARFEQQRAGLPIAARCRAEDQQRNGERQQQDAGKSASPRQP